MSGPQRRQQHQQQQQQQQSVPYPPAFQYSDPYAQHGYPQQYQYYAPNYQQQGGVLPPYNARQYQHDYGMRNLNQHMSAAHIDISRQGHLAAGLLNTTAANRYGQSPNTTPIPQTTYRQSTLPASGPEKPDREEPSSISLRYPPLPELPERRPSPLLTDQMSGDVRQHMNSLHAIIKVYEQRDEMLRLRTEAVGFEPAKAWLAWNSASRNDSQDIEATQKNRVVHDPAHPILGVRLLQRIDLLTRENEELGRALEEQLDRRRPTDEERESKLKAAHNEVADCHRLIERLDQALTKAELRASAADRALQVACASHSTSISDGPNPVPAAGAPNGLPPRLNDNTAPHQQQRPTPGANTHAKGPSRSSKAMAAGLPPNPRHVRTIPTAHTSDTV